MKKWNFDALPEDLPADIRRIIQDAYAEAEEERTDILEADICVAERIEAAGLGNGKP